MGFDGLFLHFMKEEIKAFAIGAKVDKVFLPSQHEVVLHLRTRNGTKRLFISVSGNAPRINFTDDNPENPEKPPMLCMLMRKHLTGAVVTDIDQHGLDRVLFIEFNATDEIGDRVRRTLVVEIMAQYSNCILLDENGDVIDALKRVDAAKSSYRVILPKEKYRLPPGQDKLALSACTPEAAVARIMSFGTLKLSSAILNALSGISPLTGRELAYRVCLGDARTDSLTSAQTLRLTHEVRLLRQSVITGACQPAYLTDENGELLEYSYMPLTLYAGGALVHTTKTLSELTDLFYAEKERRQRAKSKAEDLYKTVASLIERTVKKINVQREELDRSENAEEKRLYAELINASLYSLTKGKDTYTVPDFYHDYRPMTVPVRPDLSPAQNAQRYFKEYRKALTAKKVLAEQIERALSDLEYLKSVEDELSRATSERELGDIRTELSLAGFLKSKTGTKNRKNTPLPPRVFTTPDGFKVMVGRSNLQNDELTFRKAAKNDIWFHVQKAPGSHVILVTGDATPTQTAMEYAASTAVWFSSVRDRGTAEVDYTEVRHLKKPPAARPGFVIYHIYKTVYAKAEKRTTEAD